MFSVSGGLPLAKRPPQRQAYRLVELERWSELLHLPLNLQPKFFPVSADPSAKLIIAAQLAHGTDAALDLTGAVMRALWAEEKNITDADTLAADRDHACGYDGRGAAQVVARLPACKRIRAHSPTMPSPPTCLARRGMWSTARGSGDRTGSTSSNARFDVRLTRRPFHRHVPDRSQRSTGIVTHTDKEVLHDSAPLCHIRIPISAPARAAWKPRWPKNWTRSPSRAPR